MQVEVRIQSDGICINPWEPQLVLTAIVAYLHIPNMHGRRTFLPFHASSQGARGAERRRERAEREAGRAGRRGVVPGAET
eukprot:6198554-Pleurochrysis_carterae.AAC.1